MIKKTGISLFVNVLLLLAIFSSVILFPPGQVKAESKSQVSTPNLLAQAALAKMTPPQKVGQLFAVTFKGRDLSTSSQIYQLISNYHVGGIILTAANDNFSGPENTVTEAFELNKRLQQAAWDSSQSVLNDPITKKEYTPIYIPLFIGISQEGDGYPYDQIINGVTSLPNEMAIGATWKTDYARIIGNVLGKELSRLGFNLYLGPSLDVLDVLRTEDGEDLGTRTFGSDPFWVGEMGKKYIQGVHEGSDGRIIVIAKHFPGRGGSDRPPEEEIATVRKSLEQLKQIELAPFFAVTGNAPEKISTTDGLLVSHIRYQGFQGNIRATTRPVSFDPGALQQLMDLPQFSTWRANGGIIVSDNLGSQAVRKFFDPKGSLFDGKQVARNAFLAGSDLLYVDNFISPGDPDAYTTIIRTLEFFTQKYREDPAFAQRVDASVERLLTLKYQLYSDFNLENVIPPEEGLNEIGKSQQVVFEVAQRAVTLLSPDASELAATLPEPPQARERILFFTDVLLGKQCSICVDQAALPVDALQNAVVRLYGPQAGEQVFQYRLTSYSFMDLQGFLNNAPDLPPLEEDLRSADWVIFATLKMDRNRSESMALKRLLSERPELLTNKKTLVFAFNAPYYLDATNISKLSAYYGFYSKSPMFVDVAARVLFQEINPSGASPVSVPGLGYDLITATSPDPAQVIPLRLDLEALAIPQPTLSAFTLTPQALPPAKFRVGDMIPLTTGVIYDHNHNPVPDGTVVRFLFTTGGESGLTQQIETTTVGGVAKAAYRLTNQGLLEIRVVSDPASISELLQLEVSSTEAAAITSVAPTLQITETLEPTVTPTPETPLVDSSDNLDRMVPNVGNWLFSIILVWGTAFGIYWINRSRVGHRWSLRWALMSAIGGLAVYVFMAIGVIANISWNGFDGVLQQAMMIFGGILFGWFSGYFWWRRKNVVFPPAKG
ncbi:MAG: hypothetical protein HPY59_19195 [Anaerolineae bacterium]|nr:hypothetical protein [Anaerolineae bacterium]